MEAILDVLDEEVPDGMTCWISVCCRDGTHLSSGEELSRVPTIILASSAWKHKRIDGIGGIHLVNDALVYIRMDFKGVYDSRIVLVCSSVPLG